MTEAHARTAANVLMGVAAAGVAIYVLRTPSLRRLAFQLARNAAGPAAAWLIAELQRAWEESGRAGEAPIPRDMMHV